MGVTVSINHPAFPEGTEFGIDHLGVVPNGGSLEVPEENEEMFVSTHGETVEQAFEGSELVSISGSSSVEAPEDKEAPGPEQGVTSEEQEQTPEAETTDQGQEAPQDTESQPTSEPLGGVS